MDTLHLEKQHRLPVLVTCFQNPTLSLFYAVVQPLGCMKDMTTVP